MPERPRKRPADLNRLAASIVGDSTTEEPAAEESAHEVVRIVVELRQRSPGLTVRR